MDELENERSAGDDALSSRKEVAPDDAERARRKGVRFNCTESEEIMTCFSSTLDLPADWLPTLGPSYCSLRRLVQRVTDSRPPAEACPVRLLCTGVNLRAPDPPHPRRTEICERVLQVVHELDEIDIHG
jgi:hypothetical protein